MSFPDRALIEVEVVQPPTNARPVRCVTDGPDVWRAALAPGSLDEARMRLAAATEAKRAAWERWRATGDDEHDYEPYLIALDIEEECLAEIRRLRGAQG